MHQTPVKVLVVEDDLVDRMAFTRALKEYALNLDARIVSTVADALREVETGDYDLIFADYYLDDGTADKLIANQKQVPVILATGSSDIQIAVNMLKLGAYDFLVKDIDRNYLKVLPFTIEKVLQKKADRDAQQLLSSIVTNVRDIIILIDQHNRISFVNPSFCDTYGYKESEIIGMPVEILLRPVDRSNKKLFGISGSSVDQIHLHKNGGMISVHVTVSQLYDKQGKPTSRILVARDVSERLQMLEQIQQSQRQLQTIFDNSAVGIVLFEPEGSIVQANSIFSELIGVDAQKLIGKSINEFTHPGDVEIDRDSYLKLLKNKIGSYNSERRMITTYGETRNVKLTVSTVRDDKSDMAQYIIVVVEDITEKKAIQKALRETEIRVDGIMNSLKDVVYSIDPETLEINFVNNAVNDVFNLTPEQFKDSNRKWQKLIHGGDHVRLQEAHQQMIRDGRSDVEYRVLLPDGTVKWVRDRSWLIFDDQGEILRIDGIITDISKRKLAEQAHLDSEERYRTAIQNSVEAIYMLNPITFQVIDANNSFCSMLGYSYEEAIELSVYDFVMGEADEIEQMIHKILEGGGGQIGERIWFRKNGEKVNVQVNASRIKQKDQESLFVVARDISREKEIKDALEHERKLLREVIDSSPVPMVLLDDKLRFVIYSRSWIHNYGPIGKKIDKRRLNEVYPQIPDSWIVMCQRGLRGEVLSIPEQELQISPDEKIYLRLAIHPYGDSKLGNAGIVLAAERIDELVKARMNAEEANMAKSAFLARITHELRTPLNAVLGYSQIMIKDTTLSDTHHGYVDSMYKSGIHLLNMINDILDLSKIEASKMEVNPVPMNLVELLNDLIDMFRHKCEEKRIKLIYELDSNVHNYILADRSKLNQVLINLVGNAVKFTNKGEVKVSVKSIASQNPDETQMVMFTITDTGIGIPKEDIVNIFEPFHQASNSIGQGTGLGLSITKKIIDLMGGQITVTSEEGRGSEFVLSLPFEISEDVIEVDSGEFSRVTGIDSTSKIKVLIADDVPHNRRVLKILLERVGFEVYEAENGLEAVEKFKKNIPDLVILDIIMPVMDGIKAMKQMRQLKKGVNIPIIALTASGFDDKKKQLIDSGFDEYILKPFRESILLEAISRLGNIKYLYSDESDLTDKADSLIGIAEIHELLEKLPEFHKSRLIDLLELQELDELSDYVRDSAFSNNNSQLTDFIIKSVDNMDFYQLNQVLKSLKEEHDEQ